MSQPKPAATATGTLFRLDDVSVAFGGVQALDGVGLEVGPHQVVG